MTRSSWAAWPLLLLSLPVSSAVVAAALANVPACGVSRASTPAIRVFVSDNALVWGTRRAVFPASHPYRLPMPHGRNVRPTMRPPVSAIWLMPPWLSCRPSSPVLHAAQQPTIQVSETSLGGRLSLAHTHTHPHTPTPSVAVLLLDTPASDSLCTRPGLSFRVAAPLAQGVSAGALRHPGTGTSVSAAAAVGTTAAAAEGRRLSHNGSGGALFPPYPICWMFHAHCRFSLS